MNITALKFLYIILGAGLLIGPGERAVAQAGLGPVNQTINQTIDRTLDRRLPRLDDRLNGELRKKTEDAEQTVEGAPEELPPVDLKVADDLISNTVILVDGVARTLQSATAATRMFVSDVDPFGNPIEKNTLVVLIDAQQVAALRANGLAVIAEHGMPGLGLTLVTLQTSDSYGLAEKALELQKAFPGAAIDFNHLYRFQNASQPEQQDSAAVPPVNLPNTGAALRIGLIDSAVAPDHPSLHDITVTGRDFVPHEAERPVGHGTAVASVLAGASESPLTVLSASVFFQTPGHAPGASTESLVLALNWLASQGVDAINMSLAGPANDLLERALSALAADDGPAVVAAVGNNGPAGDPLYPGAYDSVLGVTAVDRKQQIFRYANRGDHVDFAALGVDIKVANASGGWRLESGTSMAAPRVALMAAQAGREHAVTGTELRALLVSNARDLGRPGFDPIFGYGLLTQPPAIVSLIKTLPQD